MPTSTHRTHRRRGHVEDTTAGPYLVQLFVYPPGDRGAVRGDDHHDDGQALLRVGPRLQPARLERFGVVVAVSFLLVPSGPLLLVRLELLYPARDLFRFVCTTFRDGEGCSILLSLATRVPLIKGQVPLL